LVTKSSLAQFLRIVNVTIVRVGSNPKLAEGWEAAFGGKKSSNKPAATAAKPAPKKTASKKAAPDKKGKKK
jgi:hypothetical protein